LALPNSLGVIVMKDCLVITLTIVGVIAIGAFAGTLLGMAAIAITA
jgi:hypothetical protein